MLAAKPGDPDKLVGVLDRILPAIGAECVKEEAGYLSRLAEIEESALTDEMRSIYQEHYASYLFKVEEDGDAAYEYREAHMPEGWEGKTLCRPDTVENSSRQNKRSIVPARRLFKSKNGDPTKGLGALFLVWP